jgi:hypothetical protein
VFHGRSLPSCVVRSKDSLKLPGPSESYGLMTNLLHRKTTLLGKEAGPQVQVTSNLVLLEVFILVCIFWIDNILIDQQYY